MFKILIRPFGTVVPGKPYVLLQFFILSFFIARSPRSIGRSPRNFATCSEACSIYKYRSKNLGPALEKFWGKNTLNLARFWTSFHFECKSGRDI